MKFAARKVGKTYHTKQDCARNLEPVTEEIIAWTGLKLCKMCEKRDNAIQLEDVLHVWNIQGPTRVEHFIMDLKKAGFAIRRFRVVARKEER